MLADGVDLRSVDRTSINFPSIAANEPRRCPSAPGTTDDGDVADFVARSIAIDDHGAFRRHRHAGRAALAGAGVERRIVMYARVCVDGGIPNRHLPFFFSFGHVASVEPGRGHAA